MTNSDRAKQYMARRETKKSLSSAEDLRFDTLADDEAKVRQSVQNTLSNWQSAEQMSATKSSLEDVTSRLKAYRDKSGSTKDMDTLISSYDDILGNWDNVASMYGTFKTADAYNKAKWYGENSGLSRADVEYLLGKTDKDSKEYEYLKEYGANGTYKSLKDYDAEIRAIKGTEGYDAQYLKRLESARNKYALTNKFDEYEGYFNNRDFAENSTGDLTELLKKNNGIFRNQQEDSSIYNAMTDDEKSVANYVYNTRGLVGLFAYLDDMEISVSKREYDKEQQKLNDWLNQSAGNKAFYTAASIVAKPFASIGSAIDLGVDAFTSEKLNPYSGSMGANNMLDSGRQTIAEGFGNVGGFLYQTTLSAADSVVGAMLFNSGYAPLMGFSAFGSAYQESLERGLDKNHAVATALLSGVAETAFEYLSVEHLLKEKSLVKVSDYIKDALVQAGIEGSEEISTETANILSDWIINGSNNKYGELNEQFKMLGYSESERGKLVGLQVIKDIGLAGLGGALSGALTSAGYNTINSQIKKSAGVNVDVDTMRNAISDSSFADELSKIESDYADNHNGDYYRNIADLYGRATEGTSKDIVDSMKEGDVIKAITSVGRANTLADAIKSKKKGKNKATAVTEEELKAKTDKFFVGEATRVDGQSIKIADVVNEDGITNVVDENGNKYDAKTVELSPSDSLMVAHAESFDDADKRSAYVKNYNGENIATYNSIFDYVWAASHKSGEQFSLANITKSLTDDSHMKTTIANIYEASKGIQKTAMDKLDAVIGEISKTIPKDSKNGKFEDETDGQSLSFEERELYKFAQTLAMRGINVRVFKDVKDESVNGFYAQYDAETGKLINRIEINLAARQFFDDAQESRTYVVNTIAHELTHFIATNASKEFSALSSAIRQYYGEEKWNQFVQKQKDDDKAAYEKENGSAEGYKEISTKVAEEEVIARACEDMLSDEKMLAEVFKNTDEETAKNILEKVKQWFDEAIAFIKKFMSGISGTNEMSALLAESEKALTEARALWIKGLNKAIARSQQINASLAEVDIRITKEGYAVSDMKSQKTFKSSEYNTNIEKAAKALAEKMECTVEEAKQYIKDVGSIANKIAKDQERLDYVASEGLSAWVSNPEYGGSLDYSFLCPKRLTYTGTMNAILKKQNDLIFSVDDFLWLRKALINSGYEAPCSFCFVESARARFGKYNAQFLQIAKDENLAYIPTAEDLTNPDMLEKMRIEHKETYARYVKFLNSLSQRKPKMLEERRAYDGDILKAFLGKEDTILSKNLHGGIRFNSFSDFEIVHMIDCMQAILDMSRVGLAGFGYTKQKAFAEVFGDTGLKINMSCVAKGIDANGRIVFDDIEGMNHNDALKLRNNNVGICCVVFTDEQLKAALVDDRIDYVLPFHRSQWSKKEYARMGLSMDTKDFTKAQTEKFGTKKSPDGNIPFLSYWNANQTGAETVQKYLDIINAEGKTPLFPMALEKDANGKWIMPIGKKDSKGRYISKEERIKEEAGKNYYKLLCEFKLYDADGNGIPQTAVKPTFNMKAANKLLRDYDGSHKTFPIAQNVVDEFETFKKTGKSELVPDWEDLRATKKSVKTNNTATFEGKPFWSGSVSLLDGFIEETHTYEEAEYWGFHHSLYFSEEAQERMDNEESAFFWVQDGYINGDWRDNLEDWVIGKIRSQISIDSSTKKSVKTNAPTFYSKMEREIDAIKMGKIGSASLIPYLKGKGVKDDEIKWSGIATFLEGKKSVTKEEVKAFVKANALQIEEKVLGKDKDVAFDTFWDDISKYYDFQIEDIDYFMDTEGNLSMYYFEEAIDSLLSQEKIDQKAYDELYKIAEAFSDDKSNSTKWQQYKTEGTTNYREILFKMPGSDYSNEAMKQHWGETGVLAHARIDDADTVDFGRMLFVEEIQSDWHNAGSKNGYKIKNKANLGNTEVRFVNGYYELFLNGEDTMTGITESHAKSENLKESEYHSYLVYWYNKTMNAYDDGSIEDAPFKDGKYIEYVMKRLIRMAAEDGYDSIGWTSGKMQEDRWSSEYAEGYRIEYDQDIPKFMQKYGKQWGAKVEETDEFGEPSWAVALTDAMKESVLAEGQPMYNKKTRRKLADSNEWLFNHSDFFGGNEGKKRLAQYADIISNGKIGLKVKISDDRVAYNLGDALIIADNKPKYPIIERAYSIYIESLSADSSVDKITDWAEDAREALISAERANNANIAIWQTCVRNISRSYNRGVAIRVYDGQNNGDVFSYQQRAKSKSGRPYSAEVGFDSYGRIPFDSSRRFDKVSKLNLQLRMNGYPSGNIKNVEKDTKAYAKALATDISNLMDYADFRDYTLAFNPGEEFIEYYADALYNGKKNDINNLMDSLEYLAGEEKEYAKSYKHAQRLLYYLKNTTPVEEMRKEIARLINNGNPLYPTRKSVKVSPEERIARNNEIESITKTAQTLATWMATNSGKHAIPTALQMPIADLLNAIDYSSKQMQRKGMPTKKDMSLSLAMNKMNVILSRTLSAQANGVDDAMLSMWLDLPDGFDKIFNILTTKVNDLAHYNLDNAYALQEMSLEELKALNDVVKAIKESVSTMNKLLAGINAHNVDEVGKKTMAEHISDTKKDRANALQQGIQKAEDFVDFNNGVPQYVFEHLGEGALQMFDEIKAGWSKYAFRANEVIEFANAVFTEEQSKAWTTEEHEFNLVSGSITMTTAQLMSLYCLSKREQARGHIFGGGIAIGAYKDENKKSVAKQQTRTVAESELDMMINSLTKEQKAVADTIQRYMTTVLANWGNEISMKRFGILQFADENYFPIKVNDTILNSEPRDTQKSIYALLNQGFTKALTDNANNELIINSIFTEFTEHAGNMAKYNALALPVLDMVKWFNYKEKFVNPDKTHVVNSVRKTLERVYGKEAEQYIRHLLYDLNGQREMARGEDKIGKFMRGYKISAVAANLQVALLQPLSYARAAYVMDTKYLQKGLLRKPSVEKCQQYSGMALWKIKLGFYDTDISRGLDRLILHTDTTKDKIIDKSGALAEMGDTLTWGALWNACEAEIMDKNPNLAYNSDEFNKKVAKRFDDVIFHTQVVDSTITRSDMMRGTTIATKVATSFMSEPTLALNMMNDAFYKFRKDIEKGKSVKDSFKKHGSIIKRATAVYLVSAVLESALRAVISKWRNPDDDEKMIEKFFYNLRSEINILRKIPIIKEVFDMLDGYKSTRMDTQVLQSSVDAYTALLKALENGQFSYKTLYKTIVAVSQATGLPMSNALREIEAVWNNSIGRIYPELELDR